MTPAVSHCWRVRQTPWRWPPWQRSGEPNGPVTVCAVLSLAAMDAGGLVIQADLPTVIAVTGVALAGVVVGPLIRRAWTERRTRYLATTVAKAVVDALDARRRGGQDPNGS